MDIPQSHSNLYLRFIFLPSGQIASDYLINNRTLNNQKKGFRFCNPFLLNIKILFKNFLFFLIAL